MFAKDPAVPLWLRALAAALAGGLTPLAFAPFDLWPLALFAPALLWLCLRDQSARRAAWLGWLFGLGFYGIGISWVYVSIHTYGNASVWLAGLLTAAFVAALALLSAAQGWMYGRLFGRGGGQWLGFVGLWLLWEWVRSWLLTGFPWLYLGYPLIDTPLALWAPVGGVWALSLIAVLLGTGLVHLLLARTTRNRVLTATLLSLPLAGVALLPLSWTQTSGAPLKVALVQGNIPQQMKWESGRLFDIISRYQQLSLQAGPVDLLVWPETAIPSTLYRAERQLRPFVEALARSGTGFISGLPSVLPDNQDPARSIYHNSLAILTPEPAFYHKQRLVPFGEYVPLESWLRGLIDFFNLPMSAFSLPQSEQQPLPFGPHRIAAAICYEIAYPELVRRSSLHSDLLLTVSNDTWFGHSIAPDQHLQIARMRALENGRWLIRATNNGISALVDNHGQIRAQAPRYQSAVLVDHVQGMRGLTPYQRSGVWPALLIAALLCSLALISRLRTSRSNSRSSSRTAVRMHPRP
ncbi:apolipoprotein N-acyltransferase [Marinobacterium sedimentorum]|uniref:apolipoprotein N-acyltransferase n=1 Tax=Marinobacterium sedimentorum TaxID=2927804 RepID=UPI0020C5EB65|nr:apolipoprotein N-acyltransferase [Marinobacterium sedimentorum]MCP8685990.1 apolipoprotein N-acyltransferase [Marinobacterium sedimentorum]